MILTKEQIAEMEKLAEPLAVLADRKGGFLGGCLPPRKHRVSIGWEVCIFNGETTVPFFVPPIPKPKRTRGNTSMDWRIRNEIEICTGSYCGYPDGG